MYKKYLWIIINLLGCGSIGPNEDAQDTHDPIDAQGSEVQKPVDPLEFTKRCMTPSKNLRALEVLTLEVVEILDELKITYWLEGGTLLGAYRFGSHMPYDDDADLGVLKTDFDQSIDALKIKLESKGYSMHNLGEHLHWQIRTQREPVVFLDLFPFKVFPGKDNYLKVSGSEWAEATKSGFPRNVIFDSSDKLGTVTLLGKQFNVPFNVEEYLKHWYPEASILTNFVIRSPHGGAYCQQWVRIPDIREQRMVLEVMLEHLEKTFEGRFTRAGVVFL